MILAVDPGLRACGCAVFSSFSYELRAAALVKNTNLKDRGPQAHLQMASAVGEWARANSYFSGAHLVLEYPRIYVDQQRRGANDPNDLLELAGVDGAITAWFLPTLLTKYFPSDWKGQTPANPTARQIVKRLSRPEQLRVENLEPFLSALEKAEKRQKDVSHSAHNTLDAVGIGLKYLGRF